MQLLDRKADLELIRRLQEQKASKDEIKSFSKILSEMDFKIRHLSVFQQELASNILDSKT